MGELTEGTWTVGKTGCVVSNIPNEADRYGSTTGHGETEHYGGFLVAESCRLKDAKMMAASKDLLFALKIVLKHAEVIITELHPDMQVAIKAIKKAES
jgi:hypothetical protein